MPVSVNITAAAMDIQRISEYPEEMLLPQELLMVQALVLAMEARLREFILPGGTVMARGGYRAPGNRGIRLWHLHPIHRDCGS